ncbi:MAG: hypothetical protein ACJ8AI_24200 [Rhodopila sp.]
MDQHRQTPTSYLDMYGLARAPFAELQDVSGFILFDSQRRTFEQLVDHMLHGTSVLTLRGEAGGGKTQCLRAASQVARESDLRVILLERPLTGRLDGQALLTAVAGEDATAEMAANAMLLPPRPVLAIDDADLLTDSARSTLSWLLERLRDRIAVVLTATMTRHGFAERPAGRELILPRLSQAEIRQYVERRLWAAGGTTRRLITADALRFIIANSQGLPGNVNRMMEATLTAGFARGDNLVNRQTVVSTFGPHRAVRERERSMSFERLAPIIATLLLIAGIVAFVVRCLT